MSIAITWPGSAPSKNSRLGLSVASGTSFQILRIPNKERTRPGFGRRENLSPNPTRLLPGPPLCAFKTCNVPLIRTTSLGNHYQPRRKTGLEPVWLSRASHANPTAPIGITRSRAGWNANTMRVSPTQSAPCKGCAIRHRLSGR